MAKMHTPVDHMFRAGQISSKEWKRLSPNGHPGKFRSQKSKMAKFESKERDEGNTKNKSVSNTTRSQIDRHQEMGKPSHAGGKPSHGGAVHGSHKSPTTDAINQHQKPLFPKYAGKTGNATKGGTTQGGGGQYSGGPKREGLVRV